jgi:hypothetical protein
MKRRVPRTVQTIPGVIPGTPQTIPRSPGIIRGTFWMIPGTF